MPPAPPTFSMMTCWPSTSESRAPRMRATVSEALPAANGTTMVTGRVGQFCAVQGVAPTTAMASSRNRQRANFMGLTREAVAESRSQAICFSSSLYGISRALKHESQCRLEADKPCDVAGGVIFSESDRLEFPDDVGSASRPSPAGGREDTASLDRPSAWRLCHFAVGTEECSQRGSNKSMLPKRARKLGFRPWLG